MLHFLVSPLQSDFMPHGQCFFWQPDILWLHVFSDGMITLAYYSIPVGLLYFIHKRHDVPFKNIFFLFGLFIFACGTTHLLGLWTVWSPVYRLEGLVKLFTAVLSIATAVLLFPVLPQALALPSPAQLKLVNEELANEITERKKAETRLRQIHKDLEDRVRERTEALTRANQALKLEIEERKRVEAEYRLIVESSPSGLIMVNGKGKIILVNSRVEKLFGYSREELLGCSTHMLVPERFRSRHTVHQTDFLKTPHALYLGVGHDVYALRKDGTEIPVEIGLNPIAGPAGTLVLSSIVDITERKRREENFRLVVEHSLSGMVMVNQTGEIVLVNSQIEQMFGYNREELIGQSVEILVPDRYRNPHPQLRNSFLGEPHARAMGAGRDLYARRKDGTEFPVEIGLNPINGSEGPLVVSSIVDITERTKNEMLLREALTEKEGLLQEVHHRVKNNLQIVSSLLKLQSALVQDSKVHEMFEECQLRVQSIALLHETLYQSRDLSKIDMEAYLGSLIKYLLHSYGVDLNAIHVSVNANDMEFDIDTALPCGMIVSELVSNSLKYAFAPHQNGTIEIMLHSLSQREVHQLVVRDDGMGIPSGVHWENPATLGWQLVRMLANKMDGKMEFTNEHGTQFQLTFPDHFYQERG